MHTGAKESGSGAGDAPALTCGWVPSTPVVMTRMSDQLGRVLSGRYRLMAPIGAGASAQVFLADDTRLRRRVAVKILYAALAEDENFLRRFRTEAQAAAALNHAHVLAVYDWGEDDGSAYLVTEYLGGGSLRGILETGHRLTPSQALLVGLESARGLDFAHRRGFVHRDIKPANLLFDDDGRLRIADFGLARALAEAAWTEPAGALVGTARYASPEQARGERVDGRSDIYSLALVLIEAVTGTVPFAADTTIATLMARVDHPVDVPAELGALRRVLVRAGRPNADERPDAGDFAVGLLATAEDLPRPQPLPLVGARPATAPLAEGETTLLPPPTTAPDTRFGDEVGGVDEMVEEIDADEAEGEERLSRRERRRARRAARTAAKADRDRSRAAREPRRWPKVVVAILAVLAVLAGAGLAFATFYTPSHEVPEFIGMTEDEALARADELGWEVDRLEDRQDGTDPGEVLRQTPEPGADLQEGETVELTISLGPPLAPVPPELAGQPLAEVQAALEAAGFAVGEVTREFDENVAADRVIELTVDGRPILTDQLPRGTAVDLRVSQGPAPRRIPDVPAGATFEQYAALLQPQRLGATRAEDFHDTVPPNQIIRVEPPPGTEVPRDTGVTVVVSRGPAVTVPPVVGMPLAQAITALQQAGLVIAETSGNGQVLSTDPPPGTVVPRGSPIRIFASA
ncbi:MAG: PASTA domain-containing protein [Acidimicrobiales bacterium]